MVRMITLYHPDRGDHGVMHVEEPRVAEFLEDGWTREAPKGADPAPSKPAPKQRKPRGTEES